MNDNNNNSSVYTIYDNNKSLKIPDYIQNITIALYNDHSIEDIDFPQNIQSISFSHFYEGFIDSIKHYK